MRAVIAVARRLAVTLHRMCVTETDFQWDAPLGPSPDQGLAGDWQDPHARMIVEKAPQIDRESGLALSTPARPCEEREGLSGSVIEVREQVR